MVAETTLAGNNGTIVVATTTGRICSWAPSDSSSPVVGGVFLDNDKERADSALLFLERFPNIEKDLCGVVGAIFVGMVVAMPSPPPQQ